VINLFPCDDFLKVIQGISNVIDVQTELNIPIATINLGKTDNLSEELLEPFIMKLQSIADKKKINITIFGKWYSLKGSIVESLKKLNNTTNDYDHFFLNLLINYDGQEEIVDASRVIIRKLFLGKENPDQIDKDLLKDNLYSSKFIPPEVIIEPYDKFTGTFLFDCVGAKIIFLKKKIRDITVADLKNYLVI